MNPLLKRLFIRTKRRINAKNCPKCASGIVEMAGYIPIKAGPLEMVLASCIPDEMPAIIVSICSKDQCDYMIMEAAPESLSLSKRIMRDTMYARRLP